MPQRRHVLFLCHDQISNSSSSSFSTFVADVESRVVVRLIGDELDPDSRTLTDHPLKRYLSAPTRVEQHHGAGVQSAPQHQPAGNRTNSCFQDDVNETVKDVMMMYPSYLSVRSKASLSRWRCSRWSFGASRDQEQERSWVAFGPWWGEGDRTRPTVAFFTVPPQRAAETKHM